MKHSCCNKILILLLLLSSSLLSTERYAFIYSKSIDDRFINFYDKVVVEADAIDNIYAIRYPQKMVAYVSVGEIEPWRKTKIPYNKKWIISKNKTWNSLIADLNNLEYQAFIFERIKLLYKKGYRNFFLDTMDAYHVTAKDKKLFKSQQKALISFIHKLHRKYPNSKLIINRGFELLNKIHNDVDAVVAESLIVRYNHANKSYIKVPKKDKEWLLSNFKKAQNYGLDAISIDYSNRSTKIRLNIAKEIKKLGVIPYVTDGLLQEQGECEIERLRRNILILFNASAFKEHNAIYSDVHLSISMPLEHFGYVPILYDISKEELPKRVEDKYHSVIIWSNGQTKNDSKIYAWSKTLKEKGLKILFFNNFIFTKNSENLKEFDISIKENSVTLNSNVTTTYHNGYKPYEIPASVDYEAELIIPKNAKPIIQTTYSKSVKSTPIAITSWGGYALSSAFLLDINNVSHWSINPFKFLKEALRLDDIPMPDPTTEAGRRILFVHIDGDGFVEHVRMEKELLSTEYLIKHIYSKYKFPQTVSLIQGEMQYLFPELTKRMEKIARELYKIPWIQPASHTLSHPFFWAKAVLPKNASPKVGKHFHLPLKGYRFSLEKETIGSVTYALSFAPKYKQKEKLLFWSGDCQPTRDILAYVEREGLLTLNGGDTTVQKKNPNLSFIAPFGIERGEYWQIYTAQQNENVYTHDWTGPFWGFKNVIETYKMTNKPYRLKPINLYYHLYSGSKLASFHALKQVYEWADKQKTSKLYTSQYIKKGRGFYRTSLAKIDNGYEVRNTGCLRTLRFDKKIEIDIASSKGVAGYNYDNNSTYITLDSSGEYLLKLTKNSDEPYLIDANGWVEKVKSSSKKYTFKLNANMPINANFHLPKSCTYSTNKKIHTKINKGLLHLQTHLYKGVTIAFKCQ